MRVAAQDDSAGRLELKYVFPRGDVPSVRALVRGTCNRVVHRHPVSTVRSIYFDDARLSACHANLDGITPRRKLRLRWYDTPMPDGEAFFEIKWRRNRVTGKTRYRLEIDGDVLERPWVEVVSTLATALPERVGTLLACNPDPIVLVEYRREHYVSVDVDLRLTLDYGLRFFDQTSCARPAMGGTACGRRPADEVIVEAKSATLQRSDIGATLYPLQKRRSRSSKYVRGCQAAGLISTYD